MDLEQTRGMLVAICDAISANVDLLTKADQAIGDGDHGVGMQRGFNAAKGAILACAPTRVGDLFTAGGAAIIATSGGASGVIFGMMLRAPGRVLAGDQFDAEGFAVWLEQAAQQIQTRGKAAPGQKTMVDALVPAAAAARGAVGDGLLATAKAAAAAAHEGKDATVDMVAKFGKAKALGDRALGHPDPGAISTTIILDTALAYLEAL